MNDVRRSLVLTYHAVAPGPPPLSIDPALFAQHVAALVEAGCVALTVSELADALREGDVPPRTVAITFDDAFASVAEHAEPVLTRHGLRATVFAVTGHVGGRSDWPTQPVSAPLHPLLDAGGLRRLAALGWEIGSHGRTHRRLGELGASAVEEELRGSREELARLLGGHVPSFAYPYGSVPPGGSAALQGAGYQAGCTTRLGHVVAGSDPFALPRVDAHYVRSPARLRRIARGGGSAYLGARRVGARARCLIVQAHRVWV